MCYNFATFVLYLDVITLIYRENRLTSSETSLSAAESCKSQDLRDFFCYTPFACAGLNKKKGSNNIAMFKQINII